MTINAIILYGSRARNDSRLGSDTDILGISKAGSIRKPFDDRGVSFHIYPMAWMLEQSNRGTLFLLHITSEAVALYDPHQMLDSIKQNFRFKESYQEDIEIGARVVMAIVRLTTEQFNSKMRARYFWGLRTAIIAAAAEQRKPIFSSVSLEHFCRIDGLASHIRRRQDASLNECKEFGMRMMERLGLLVEGVKQDTSSENLAALLDIGGLAALTAGQIIYE